MSLKRKLRTLLVCLPLLLGSMSGVPMRPEEVEELMQEMNEQQMVYVMPGGKRRTETNRCSLQRSVVARHYGSWELTIPANGDEAD